ncbi:hypothetical protein VB854_11825 [Limnoraphis robusta CCNP1315]|uniref:Uncharacterized protein n=2 Tax=Limnoraphis TaxID=1332112 RepID=A0ABU5TXH0_9CYAN|nr:hypothetical protein [Limnoraphis robusta CCNP1315]
MPLFHYELLRFNKPNYLCICDDVTRVYKITDLRSFYASFGVTEDMYKKGVDPEFYIWEKFTKETALNDDACKQAIIIEYLKFNSAKFRTEFAEQYMNWIGTCNSKKINLSTNCLSCKKHPRVKP